MELIEEIRKHSDKNNMRICNQLIDVIEDYNIQTKEDLLKRENNMFSSKDLKEKLDIKYQDYLSDTSYIELLDNKDMNNLQEYERLYLKANIDLEKCKYLMLIYDYINYMLFFPYEAFLLIMSDNLKGRYDDEVRDLDDDEFIDLTGDKDVYDFLEMLDEE